MARLPGLHTFEDVITFLQTFAAPHDESLEPFNIDVDNGSGADPAEPIRLHNQSESTAYGAFATVDAAIDALPDIIRHDITIRLTDGVHSSTQMRFDRIDWGTDGMEGGFTPETGNVIFTSLNGRVIESGTVAMAVSSSSGVPGSHIVTLQADPGHAADQFQDYLLEVTSGTGAGQYKPIRSHTGTNFDIAGTFGPALDNTSVVEIRRPAANIEFTETLPTIKFKKHSTSFGIDFNTVDLTNSNALSGITFEGGNVRISGGARVIDMIFQFINANFVYQTCVIANDVPGGFAVLTFSGGFFRTSSGTSEPIFMRSSAYARAFNFNVKDKACGCFIFGGHQFDGFTGPVIRANGSLVSLNIVDSGSAVPITTGASHAVHLENGAVLYCDPGNLSSFSSTFVGTTADIDFDDTDLDWSDVDSDPDKFAISSKGSKIWESAT